MNLNELKTRLRAQPNLTLAIELPGGERIPAHFHVTEAGCVARKFVDCGGTFRASESCVLQVWFGRARDDGHRLTAGRLAMIIGLAGPIIPAGGLPVEIEYELGLVSQFPLVAVETSDGLLVLRLGLKHTDCRAKAKCGCADQDESENGKVAGREESEACCAGPVGRGSCGS
jgi:hypothetical protein